MTPWENVTALRSQAADLKLKRDFVGMLPLREKITKLLEQAGADVGAVANAMNYLAALNLQLEQYSEAEKHARRSVAYYEDRGGKDGEYLASYLRMLAWSLAFQERFEEAIPFAERAIIGFSESHASDDHFLMRCKAELEDFRREKLAIRFEF